MVARDRRKSLTQETNDTLEGPSSCETNMMVCMSLEKLDPGPCVLIARELFFYAQKCVY